MRTPGESVTGRMRPVRAVLLILAALVARPDPAQETQSPPDILLFAQAISPDAKTAESALSQIAAAWRDGYAAMIIDLARLMPSSRAGSADTDLAPDDDSEETSESSGFPGSGEPGRDAEGASAFAEAGSPVRRRLIRFLERQTGQRLGDDLDRWRRWLWSLPYEPHPAYAEFKRGVYGQLDPRFREFFAAGAESKVRLDQIDWGGVGVDGIPLLDHPRHVPAAEAGYLKDKHVVFGLLVDGEARAYPQRILAWHELARDRLGGEELAVVYCPLCGALIPYRVEVGPTTYRFRTSGLLYRSNKLMFDEQTKSLWSTIYGEPLVGPLVGSGIRLDRLPVVTTTWGEWRATHPETTVLSLETGFVRDYGEGTAYKDYSRTDEPMFAVPRIDDRLANKAEVLVLRDPPLAIPVRSLEKQPLYAFENGGRRYVVITSPAGANRVYEAPDARLLEIDADGRWVDERGTHWRATEPELVPDNSEIPAKPRVEAHRVFWFAWYAHYPETRLLTSPDRPS